jgi:hypothetical protein
VRSRTLRALVQEWLFFVGGVVLGFVSGPLIFLAAGERATDFYEALFFTRHDWWVAWLCLLVPYFVLRILRSIRRRARRRS